MAPSLAVTRFVGLSGSWGRFYMGHYSAPYDDITDHRGQYGQYRILSQGNLWAQGSQDVGMSGQATAAVRQPAGKLDSLGFAELGGIRDLRAIRVGRRRVRPAERNTGSNFRQDTTTVPSPAVIAYQYNNNVRGVVNSNLDDSAFSMAAQWQFSRFNIAFKYEWLDYDYTQSTTSSVSTGVVFDDPRRRQWQCLYCLR